MQWRQFGIRNPRLLPPATDTRAGPAEDNDIITAGLDALVAAQAALGTALAHARRHVPSGTYAVGVATWRFPAHGSAGRRCLRRRCGAVMFSLLWWNAPCQGLLSCGSGGMSASARGERTRPRRRARHVGWDGQRRLVKVRVPVQ